jgi:hypothetical protein
VETRTDPIASGRKGKVRLSSPPGTLKKALSHCMSKYSCLGLMDSGLVTRQSATAFQMLLMKGLMRGTIEAANMSFPAMLRRGLRRSGPVVLMYLSPSMYSLILSSGIESDTPESAKEIFAPIQVTVLPPSDLCQARGNPATTAHRRARVSGSVTSLSSPAAKYSGSSTNMCMRRWSWREMAIVDLPSHAAYRPQTVGALTEPKTRTLKM